MAYSAMKWQPLMLSFKFLEARVGACRKTGTCLTMTSKQSPHGVLAVDIKSQGPELFQIVTAAEH